MVSAVRTHHSLYKASKLLPDPGDGKIITVNLDLQTCELVTGASGETRTLTVPTKPGIRFTLRLLTDGGGDAVVTSANGMNVTGHTIATFADAGDQLDLISVTHTTGYRWEILTNTGSVAMS